MTLKELLENLSLQQKYQLVEYFIAESSDSSLFYRKS